MNLYQKIVEVRKVASGFTKDTTGHNYSYVSGNQILSKIKDKMNELNLLLIPSTALGEHVVHQYKNRYNKDMIDFIVKGEMTYTWVNGDKPDEREVVSWAYYGQQDEISKAYGSGLTYSERYFLLKCLGLPTDEDDPDGKQGDPPQQGQSQQGNNRQNNKQSQGQTRSQQTKGQEPQITITPTIKAKYQMVNGNLDGIEDYVQEHGDQAERLLTEAMKARNSNA